MDEIKSSNFIHDIIDEELSNGTYRADEIHTRFPPEPNGYLHIGSVKAICINTDVAKKYGVFSISATMTQTPQRSPMNLFAPFARTLSGSEPHPRAEFSTARTISANAMSSQFSSLSRAMPMFATFQRTISQSTRVLTAPRLQRNLPTETAPLRKTSLSLRE